MQLRRKLTFLLLSFSLLIAVPVLASDNDYYIKKFKEVFEIVDKNYVHAPDKEKMLEAAINGMVSALDPHSNYMNKDELADLTESLKGEFGGIGIEIIFEGNALKIISPIEDLPAARAGVKPGDTIIEVNDVPVSNLGYSKSIKNMRGTAGTKVRIKILRAGETKPIELELIREIVKVKSVKYRVEDDIAYIKIITFNKTTTNELEKAFNDLQASSKEGIKGIILDLRNNPGGLLDQAVSVANFFIDEGVIVSTKGRTKSSISVEKASKLEPKAPKVPTAVLINFGSASASEIVAGALQEYRKAIIMGTRSFGKGSVQTPIPVLDGALRLTIAKYYTPNGKSIQAEGIVPDIIVEPAKVEYMETAQEERKYTEAALKNHLKNEDSSTDASKDIKHPELSDIYKKDYQYARAFDLVKSLALSNKTAKPNAKKSKP